LNEVENPPDSLAAVRILYLVPNLFGPPGGIARHARLVCRAVLNAGANITVLALQDREEYTIPMALAQTKLQYRPCFHSRLRFVLRAAFELRTRPTIVIVQHVNLAPLGWIMARVLQVPLVIFAHGTEVWEPLRPWRRWALRHANRVVCVSKFTMRRAAEVNGLAVEKSSVLYSCLDPSFAVPPAGSARSPAPSILTVARMAKADPYKGHRQVLEALPTLLESSPNLVYHIVGDGDDRNALEALTASLDVAHAVRFHGSVSDDALARLYAEAWAFVMPSQFEGFGLSFVEAMAYGTPAIGGTEDAAPEVIVQGETGYLVDPSSVVSIATAIQDLICDPDLRHRMGRSAAAHVQRSFSYDAFRGSLTSLIQGIIEEHRGGSR
jgi:phosphatidyl-myo-inositol dimannoside synthase